MNRIFLIIQIFIFSICITNIYASDFPGAAQSLAMKNDSRATALGSAYTSIDNAGGCLYYNPAGIASIKRMMFSASVNLGLAESFFADTSVFMPFNFGTAAVGFHYFGIPSDQIFDPDGTSLGTASDNDLDLYAAFGKKIINNFFAGLGAEFVDHKHINSSAILFGFNTGLIYKSGRFNFGLSYKDILIADNLNFGMSSKWPLLNLLLTGDVSYYFYGKVTAGVGAEYTILNLISFRAGYKYGYTLGALSFGIGFLPPIPSGIKMTVDYSINPNMESSLGQMQSLNVQIALPVGNKK